MIEGEHSDCMSGGVTWGDSVVNALELPKRGRGFELGNYILVKGIGGGTLGEQQSCTFKIRRGRPGGELIW